ncbi:MAG TPA: ABC transporter ATP-binding protein [Solirubrobacteraceae bacterium]|nr:ABC transporter ATP-binding protein [Solirubrobacteraceae bacterium]
MAAAPAIELRGLARAFGERTALADVSLALAAGATLVVFGPNGAGKTTLLRVLATLLRPTGGDARVLGSELPGRGHEVRGRLGFLGHDALLYRDLTGRENLRYHARLRAMRPERIEALLERVDMTGRGDEPLRTLSRGMVQRLAVCRAVLHEPELLLLDEPRSHLDPAAAELVEPLIGRASGRSRVVASHDPAGGIAEADLVLGLRAGRQAFVAPVGEVDAGRIGALYR